MKAAQGLVFLAALAPLSAMATTHDPSIERTVQMALERLQSGVTLTARLDNGLDEIRVRALRTWKSVTGHYCRDYEARIIRAGQSPVMERQTRCRDADGVWKKVETE